MRDAFGGAFLIKLFLVFIIVYVSFIAIALNYAKAFRVKNKVIEYIEENELAEISTASAKKLDTMEQYFEKEIFGKMNYKVDIKCPKTYEYCKNGILITKVTPKKSESNKLGSYYKVTTYFGFDISFFNILKALDSNSKEDKNTLGKWSISGETRPINGSK